MRRALATAAALLLAACQVDVEGAGCRVPGASEDCPSGQACGNDGRCSEGALACETAGTRCDPGAARCAGGEDDDERVERCRADPDAACGAWVAEDCAGVGLECGERGGSAACECPAAAAPAADFAADPVAGSPDPGAVPFPTGALFPEACRFERLGDALDAARLAAEASGSAASVRAHGAAGAPVVFGDVATAEQLPLEIAPDVTLYGAEAPAGQTIVRIDGVTDAILVAVQGAVEGIRVESTGATGTGVAATCGASGAPRIEDVTVDGGGALAKGIDVAAGACGAALSGVEVSGAAGPALSVVADAGAAVTVTGSTFRDSGSGIRATGGKLTLGSAGAALDVSTGEVTGDVTVKGNAGEGIVLTGGSTRVLDVEILRAAVKENGGTGVVLENVSTASALVVRECVVFANGDTAARSYGGASPRIAGGVLIRQTSLATLGFAGNRLSSNAGDQLAFESSGDWSISPGSCALANVVACVGDGAYAIGVKAGGTVDASYTVWPAVPWADLASTNVTAPAVSFCNGEVGAPTLPGSCPGP